VPEGVFFGLRGPFDAVSIPPFFPRQSAATCLPRPLSPPILMPKKAAATASPTAKKAPATKAAGKSAPSAGESSKPAVKKTAAAAKPAAKTDPKPAAPKPTAPKPAKPAASGPKSGGSKAPVKAAPKPPLTTAKSTIDLQNFVPIKITRPANWEMTPWHKKQKQKLIELRDALVDAMDGVARDSLEGGEASAFGMHQADAGSDAYDRDFALNMLSKEQDALYEIEEALKRMDAGTYGICEMSEKKIPHLRLEAIPFARYTVECQAQLEKENRGGYGRRPPVRSLFGLGGEDDDDDEDSEGTSSSSSSDSND
jgi:RNA polymerase-binding transcription factor DksA